MKKPILNINTKAITSGHEGLNKEKEWRDKTSSCEHPKSSIYIGGSQDNKDPLLCDAAFPGQLIEGDKNRSTTEKILEPTILAI
jgi:hypothetical protein